MGLRLVGGTTTRKSTAEETEVHKQLIEGADPEQLVSSSGQRDKRLVEADTKSGYTTSSSSSSSTPSAPVELSEEAKRNIAIQEQDRQLHMQENLAYEAALKAEMSPSEIYQRDLDIMNAENAAEAEVIKLGGAAEVEEEGAKSLEESIKIAWEKPIYNPTSLKLTAALAATLAATYGASIVASSVGTFGATTSSIELTGPGTLQQAANIAVNTKSVGLTASSLVTKLGLSTKMGQIIAGTLAGSIILGKFQLAEASDKFGIALMMATNAEDLELAAELEADLLQLTDPGMWGQIQELIPLWSAWRGITINLEAARTSAMAYIRLNDRRRKELSGELESKWDKIYREAEEREIAQREEDLRQREEDKVYYETIAETKRQADEESREADKDYYARIDADRKAKDDANRKADADYYNTIWEEQEKRDKAKLEWEAEYFRLLREGKHDEAAAMLRNR